MNRLTVYVAKLDKRLQLAIAYTMFLLGLSVGAIILKFLLSPLRDYVLLPALVDWEPDERRFVVLLCFNVIMGSFIVVAYLVGRRNATIRRYWDWFISLSDELPYRKRRPQ